MCVCVCVFVSETRCSLIIIFFPPRFSFFWASNGRLFSFLFSRKRLCWRTASSLSLSFIAVRSRWPSRHAVVGFLFSLFIFVALLPLFVSPFSAGTCRKPVDSRSGSRTCEKENREKKQMPQSRLSFLSPLIFSLLSLPLLLLLLFPPSLSLRMWTGILLIPQPQYTLPHHHHHHCVATLFRLENISDNLPHHSLASSSSCDPVDWRPLSLYSFLFSFYAWVRV